MRTLLCPCWNSVWDPTSSVVCVEISTLKAPWAYAYWGGTGWFWLKVQSLRENDQKFTKKFIPSLEPAETSSCFQAKMHDFTLIGYMFERLYTEDLACHIVQIVSNVPSKLCKQRFWNQHTKKINMRTNGQSRKINL